MNRISATLLVIYLAAHAFGQTGNIPYEESVNENTAVSLIDLEGLAPGVYIISIEVPEGQFQKRVVLQ